MYKFGHRKKNVKHFIYTMLFLLLIVGIICTIVYLYLEYFGNKTEIQQTKVSSQKYDPGDSKNNIKIDTELYTMQLPPGWKQISHNKDTRYLSTQWQNGNRILELFTDKIPVDTAFNRILPVNIENDIIELGLMSDNCSKFTAKTDESDLKVMSKWDNASFLCDLSNWSDNIIGVSDKETGTTLQLTGDTKGLHSYMFIYTDRGIPEDVTPITTALRTLEPK